MMKRLLFFILIAASLVSLQSCDDSDSFSTNRSDILSFSRDTVSLDTVFSTVPTPTYTFWVYNNNDEGLRLRQVRLQRGNQSGFRVNVDGSYLDNTQGSLVHNLEVRGGDSIRVFVELTSPRNHSELPQLVEDNLIFSLESGVEQKVNLRAYSWDALLCHDVTISRDSVITGTTPIVIYGGLKVDSGVTLRINSPATLYFHKGAGIDVYGKLLINGTAAENVTLRGDRTDWMFDYLPYDRVSGQWKGIRIHSSSSGNEIVFADIHGTDDGIVCDSAAYDSISPRLVLENVILHNCNGNGLSAYNSNIEVANSQITNTLGDCVALYGGRASFTYCTIAQFYPFEGNRGVAFRFCNYNGGFSYPLYGMECRNTIITGYSADEVMGQSRDSSVVFNYQFTNCILRTGEIEDSAQLKPFVNVLFESQEDSVNGTDNFADIDSELQYYDFHLDSLSTARGRALPLNDYPMDREGNERGTAPDIGCYQYKEPE